MQAAEVGRADNKRVPSFTHLVDLFLPPMYLILEIAIQFHCDCYPVGHTVTLVLDQET
jgi:hypothetical protein